MGVNLGSVFGIGVLLTVMRHFDIKTQFYIMGGMNVILGLLTPCMVKEPPDLKEKRARRKRQAIQREGDQGGCA